MPDLRVGYGEEIITPHLGIELTGYGYYLNRKAERVLDDLKVRALFLQYGSISVILISCDLLSMAVEYADLIREEVAELQGIPRENVLLFCTHTHTGPALQNLPGLGESDENYSKGLPALIVNAVRGAEGDLAPAEPCYCESMVEPIGFNRRNMSSDPIDPMLRSLILKRKEDKIYLLNYACHPVTLGPVSSISSDWPGAVISVLESYGHRGIFFQGFCGDIDPLCNLASWGSGNNEVMYSYGRSLCRELFSAEKSAALLPSVSVRAVERRLNLALSLPSRAQLEEDKAFWLKKSSGFSGSADRRFIEEWAERAENCYDSVEKKPFLDNVPIQAIFIGPLKVLCLPGEAFCRYALRLYEEKSATITIGYANGDIGYLPTRDAYADAGDYACYGAPKFYCLFPFTEEIEDIILDESRALLSRSN